MRKPSKKKVKDALALSVQHWANNATGREKSTSSRSCALCLLFLHTSENDKDDCVGCPVRKATGKKYCFGTPYKKAHDILSHNIQLDDSDRELAFRVAALEEYDFLKTLSVK